MKGSVSSLHVLAGISRLADITRITSPDQESSPGRAGSSSPVLPACSVTKVGYCCIAGNC